MGEVVGGPCAILTYSHLPQHFFTSQCGGDATASLITKHVAQEKENLNPKLHSKEKPKQI